MKDRTKYSNKSLHIVLGVTAIVISIPVAYMLLFGEFVPANTQTALAMNNCKQRIQEYAIAHNELPKSLYDTKEITGSFNSNKDGWDNEILYSYDANGLVTLKSLGKDNKPGGTGKNEDIIGTYQSHQISGGWAQPTVEWIKDPFKGMRRPRRL